MIHLFNSKKKNTAIQATSEELVNQDDRFCMMRIYFIFFRFEQLQN